MPLFVSQARREQVCRAQTCPANAPGACWIAPIQALLNLTVLGVALLISTAAPVFAVTHTLTVTTDSVDAFPGDGSCADALGECSLRAAVMESNAAAGADEIVLAETTYALTIVECGEGTDVGFDDACGDLDVTDTLTIRGVGGYRSIVTAAGLDNTGNGGHFEISSSGDLTLEDLLLRDGNNRGSGGAIRNSGGDLTVRRCVLYGNQASFSGGAIDTRDGTAHIEGTVIYGNTATTATIGGGAIFHSNASAPAGTTLTVVDSSLAGNSATGGSVGSTSDGRGGAISLGANAVAELTQVTMANNLANGQGGGLAISDDATISVVLTGSTITGNRADADSDTALAGTGNGGGLASLGAANLEIYNTLIAANLDPIPADFVRKPDCLGHAAVISHSLIDATGCTATTFVNFLSDDPLIGLFGDHGGSVPTVPFDISSPARDAADGSRCPLLDARGELRFQNGACDIGAWESGHNPRYLPQISTNLLDNNAGDGRCHADYLPGLPACTLRAAVEELSAQAAEDAVTGQIRLGAFSYPASGSVLEVTGLLTVTIQGIDARSTSIVSDGADRVFDVDRFSDGADLTLRRLTVMGGESDAVGGNIQVRGQGSFLGDDIAIVDGTANRGGGLAVHDIATAELTDSTVSGNLTFADQGGGGDGAGIYAAGQDLDLTNVTVSGNIAEGSGGGIAVNSGLYTFNSITVTDNSADDDGDDAGDGGGVFFAEEENGSIANSLIAGNFDVGGGEAPDCSGLVDSVGHNLIGATDGSCGFVNVNDQTGTLASPLNPAIGPLADNGGGTDTHVPLGGSPVVDAGATTGCPATGQRGMARPLDGDGDGNAQCDIGAVEAGDVGIFEDQFESGDTSRWTAVVQ